MLEYQKVLKSHKKADDPWKELANAIVEMTADDYRRNMTRLIKHGLSMSAMEMVAVQSHIIECRVFFESDWGNLLSHGLADVIWEKLQAEFADDLAWFEARLPYMQKHRRKLERKRKAAQRRWEKNKSRRKRQRKFMKKVAAIRAAMETNNEADALREDWLQNGENEFVYDTNSVLDSIDNAATIVPAEGGGEE